MKVPQSQSFKSMDAFNAPTSLSQLISLDSKSPIPNIINDLTKVIMMPLVTHYKELYSPQHSTNISLHVQPKEYENKLKLVDPLTTFICKKTHQIT